ncbi:hypothetical protein [Pontibacillus sp. HMF3514]|uniref:hypothetical protein n=1 Tax=Pontibacillus sp. HMF3514 TaxID=2692425 RepID=UPI00131FFD28|nr:hypothetical protein [Pontibacillus sp. HMF3514]QHE52725.1 hypothetical protein GS400_12095 [Pontibacillus sp. HMF3514]
MQKLDKFLTYFYIILGAIFGISFLYTLFTAGELILIDGAFAVVAFFAAYMAKRRREKMMGGHTN